MGPTESGYTTLELWNLYNVDKQYLTPKKISKVQELEAKIESFIRNKEDTLLNTQFNQEMHNHNAALSLKPPKPEKPPKEEKPPKQTPNSPKDWERETSPSIFWPPPKSKL